MNTKITAFAVPAIAGFAASKFVFSVSTQKALIIGAIIGGISIALISIQTPQPVTTP